jgi:hypothetical protein
LTALLSAGAMAVGADKSTTTNKATQDVDSLRRALADQVERNRLLESKVKELQYRLKELEIRNAAETRVAPEIQRVPEDWRPFQFNGTTIYVIPLGVEQTTTLRSTTRLK